MRKHLRVLMGEMESGAGFEIDLALLEHAESYEELASLLTIDAEVARSRVVDAVTRLVPEDVPAPPEAVRAQVIDYLLEDQTILERLHTRSLLERSTRVRDWARQARLELSLVLEQPLPAIPGGPPPRRRGGGPAGPPPLALEGEYISSRPRAGGRIQESIAPRLLALGALVLAGLAALGVVLHATRARRSTTASTVALEHFRLRATSALPHASGLGRVVPRRGNLILLLEGTGLRADRHAQYAVWLYNRASEAKLLGRLPPSIPPRGRFSWRTNLPPDAGRFHMLIVAAGTGVPPSVRGDAILRARLSLQ